MGLYGTANGLVRYSQRAYRNLAGFKGRMAWHFPVPSVMHVHFGVLGFVAFVVQWQQMSSDLSHGGLRTVSYRALPSTRSARDLPLSRCEDWSPAGFRPRQISSRACLHGLYFSPVR